MAVVVIMGLCLVPSLYAWFNILSNWDPDGPASTSNTPPRSPSQMRTTARSCSGMTLNIGEMVMEGLESNDQMGWVFLDTRDEALSGVYSGKYYAALIVPPEFTGDFLSIMKRRASPSADRILRKREEKRNRPEDNQQGQDRRARADKRYHR